MKKKRSTKEKYHRETKTAETVRPSENNQFNQSDGSVGIKVNCSDCVVLRVPRGVVVENSPNQRRCLVVRSVFCGQDSTEGYRKSPPPPAAHSFHHEARRTRNEKGGRRRKLQQPFNNPMIEANQAKLLDILFSSSTTSLDAALDPTGLCVCGACFP